MDGALIMKKTYVIVVVIHSELRKQETSTLIKDAMSNNQDNSNLRRKISASIIMLVAQ